MNSECSIGIILRWCRRPSRNASYSQTLQWRHNESDGVSYLDCLLNHLFRHRSKKTSKLRATGLCKANTLVTWRGTSNAEKVPFDDIIMKHRKSCLCTYTLSSVALVSSATSIPSQIARFMRSTWGPPGPHVVPMWAPCWPHEPCYLGWFVPNF